jgi:hypothetical protein
VDSSLTERERTGRSGLATGVGTIGVIVSAVGWGVAAVQIVSDGSDQEMVAT